MELEFSNPRLKAEFSDWPSGRDRVKCEFFVEDNGKKGVRVGRRTQKNGVWCKTKYDTYCKKAVIVDGNDGKTYLLILTNINSITVAYSDFMHKVSYSDGNDEYKKLLNLILSVK